MSNRALVMILAAGLAGGVLSVGCKSSPSKTSAPPAVTKEAALVPAPGGERGAPPETGGAVPAPSGGSTEPDPSFELSLVTPPPVAVAGTASAKVVVHPAAGKKMNKDYPTSLSFAPPAGVTMTKTAWKAEEATTFDLHELSYEVALSAAAPGEYRVPGTFRFAVCDDSACYPKKRAVEVVLTVQ